jgi:nucleoside 2-deoxyribosyltransferase
MIGPASKKLIFISGPFRARTAWDIECNIRRAEELALEVWRLGHPAICPHSNTRFFQDAAPDEVWLDGYIEMLRRCDAMILTEDWEQSSGTLAERAYAIEHGIPVFTDLTSLKEFLED